MATPLLVPRPARAKGAKPVQGHTCAWLRAAMSLASSEMLASFLSLNRRRDHADTVLIFEFGFFYTFLPTDLTMLLPCRHFKSSCTRSLAFVVNPWLKSNFLFTFFFAFNFPI